MEHGRLFLCVAVVMAVSAVRADSYSWLPTSGTASFQNSSSWSPNGVPGASDSATFGTAGTYGVTFAADAQNSGATVGSAGGTDATFGLGGCAWLLGNLTFTGSAAAHFGGGTLKVNGTPSMGANQRLTLESGACSFVGLALSNPGGSVEVYGGDHSVSNGASLYPTVSGGPGLRITNGTFWVQAHNGGRLVLNNGTGGGSVVNVEGGTIKVGNLDIYQGAINVYTNGTYLTATANIGRGNRYAGAVNIFGGTVSNYMGSNVGLGMAAWNSTSPATGIVNLVDGVLYNSSGINLGGSPTDDRTTNSVGILNVAGGWLYAPTLTLGRHTGTLGVYTQSAGQAWCSNLLLGNGGTGARGEVYLSGGTLALASYPYLGNAATCTGRLYQTGGNLLISNSVVVGGAMGASGFFRQEGGTLQLNGSLYVGNATNAYGFYEYDGGSATINGSVRIGNVAGAFGKVLLKGSSLYVRDDWLIGAAASATGELEIAGGTLIRPVHLNVAASAGSVGLLRVTGGDLVVSNSLYVGRAGGGYGELTLESGSIRVLGSSIGVVIGSGIGATGAMHVAGGSFVATNWYALFAADSSGAYGEIVISGGTNDFASGRIGHNTGTGLLRVEGGTTYFTNAINSRLTIGNMAGSTGRLEVVGGVLSVLSVGTWSSSTTDITSAEILFDGGTLQRGATGDTAAFVDTGFDQATLTGRGAVIDSNGTSLGIPQALSDEPGHAGRFTKRGAGTVTLSSSWNTFTGSVCVEEGELAVSGAIYLTGGVAVDAGAVLKLTEGIVRDTTTGAGTTSRVDGAVCLPSGVALTNEAGSVFSGSGVVTGSVVFAEGSVWALDKGAYAGPLHVTGTATFDPGAMVQLTGYTMAELVSGIALVRAVDDGIVQASGMVPVTLDGVSHPDWWAKPSSDKKTFVARVFPKGTLMALL